MRAKAQRSRACNQCRERRVKCDETPEFCQQCRRLGLKCSGPIQGSVIIDMTDKVAKPRQRRKREPKPKVEIPEKSAAEQPTQVKLARIETESRYSLSILPLNLILGGHSAHLGACQQEGDDMIEAVRMHYRLPMLYQPSQADAFDRAFISHYVELNRGVRTHNTETQVVAALPGLHTKATNQALKLSVRAATMAFYAQVHQNTSILADSHRWYTKSLNCQRLALSRLNKNSIPDEEELFVPIILGLYEVYAGTSPASVFQHLTASTRIFQMRGPKNCSSGPAHILLRAIRISDGHKAVIFNQPSILSSSEWMTIPFSTYPKNAHQHLADILLKIPACIALSGINGSLGGVFAQPIPRGTDLTLIGIRSTQLLRDLDDWAEKHPHLCASIPVAQNLNWDMRHSVRDPNPATPTSPASVLPDSLVALTAATYNALRLILTLLHNKVSLPIPSTHKLTNTQVDPSIPNAIATATSYSKAILEIVTCLELVHPIGFDFMRSVFPLVVVAVLGPRIEEQEVAREMLVRWGKNRGLGGLCDKWTNS
ncbi:hypothetical protein CC78DRAFT_612010 [Lojkania enalia]|uniref:Zn(2)-C6 fungal-type domain-containing protein n=1 Tax=Lojkania enalia TaxID=147567 RepID=A0A9P4NAK4_9PLEO|nr:hypothetical protein CC78DRAFT_612010 [Didymosphaeria enalia]